MVNVPLLEQTMQHIIDYPELHNQGWYFRPSECGTAMCFAGRACDLEGLRRVNPLGYTGFGPGTDAMVETNWGQKIYAKDAARILLDLTRDAADTLFNGGNTQAMLEAMVKDLANTGNLNPWEYYYHDLVPE